MPLAPNPPNTPAPAPQFPQALAPNIAAPEYKTSLVDTTVTPVSALLTHVEGSSWVVEYYRQVVGADEELTPYQPHQLAIYQQYLAVKNFELKVTSPLSQSQDAPTNAFIVTGVATTYPFLIPNEGDTFLADVGDGRTGQFTVDRVTRKTIFKETCYELEYTLTRYVTKEIHEDLMNRVVKTLYFEKEFLTFGQNPMITESDFINKQKVARLIGNLTTEYFQLFFSREFQTFLVPGQAGSTYDPFVTNALLAITDVHQFPKIQRIKQLNVEDRSYMTLSNLWNVLLDIGNYRLDMGFQKSQLLSANAFNRWPIFQGVAYTGIEYVVYPNEASGGVDDDYPPSCNVQTECICEQPYYAGDIADIGDMDWDLKSLFIYTYAGGLTDDTPGGAGFNPNIPPWIHPVTIDEYYVFSRFFYQRAGTGQSQLELQVRNAIDGNPIDIFKLFQICDSMMSWGRLEKFYYYPAVIILLKICQLKM